VKRSVLIVTVIVVAFLCAFMFFPLVHVFREAFFPGGEFSLSFFVSLFTNPISRQSIANSFMLAGVATAATILLAVPLAFVTVRYCFPAKAFLSSLLLVPMIMPPFVGAIGMRQFLARFGSINLLLMDAGLLSAPVDWLGGARFWGVVIMEVLHLYPIMYLNVSAALANVDPSLEEAAVNMGSGGWRLFRKVTLPLMMPGFFAGTILVFIWAFTDLGTPLVFEYRRVIPVQIFDRVTDLANNPEGYALVVVVMVLTLVTFLLAKLLMGRKYFQALTRGPARVEEKKPSVLAQGGIACFILLVVCLACLPHLSVILTSIRGEWFMSVLPQRYTMEHFRSALGHGLTLPGIRNSILYSSLSTVVDVVLGIAIAVVLVRHRFRGADVLDAVVMLPLAIPGLVLAFGYVASFAGTPLDPRENPVPLLVIAYAVRRLPYMVRAAYAGLQQLSVSLEEAAKNLGSPPLRVLRRVTVPLLSANLIAGGVLVFAFAMLEVSDSLILAFKERFFPLTKAIYHMLGRLEDGPYIASALGVWAMAFLALALLAAGVLMGRRMGQIFRA